MAATSPPTDDLDDELLAALGESRLTREEEEHVIQSLRLDAGARAAFRDLYPERYAALFGHNVVALAGPDAVVAMLPATSTLPGETAPGPELGPMPPTPPAWRLLAAGLVASFALLLILAMPAARPHCTRAVFHPDYTRSAGAASGPVPLLVDLGEPSRWDALRGRSPWGAVVVAGTDGHPTVLATSARPGDCTATEETLACLTRTAYTGVAVIVAPAPADAALDALVNGSPTWGDLRTALIALAADEPWAVHFPLENGGR